MAELLKRQFDIIVLKVELLSRSNNQENVRFTLQCKVEGELTDVLVVLGDTAAMGLRTSRNERGQRWIKLHAILPDPLLAGLRVWFQGETKGDQPLWIHLVTPYGALRFVPWERILGETLHVPILMLPDYIFPPPRETAEVLEIALCASAPLGCEESYIQQTLVTTVDRILESQARRMRIHVFTDSVSNLDLEKRWKLRGWLNDTVILHPQTLAEKYVTPDLSSRLLDSADLLRSPWLLWMREALKGRAVDLVHFICHGYLARDCGAILFAQSPLERTDRYLAGPVGFTELQSFLTQVGAWATAFSSVPDNFSEAGLRALSDDVTQNRPGPLLLHAIDLDPESRALPQAYRFLFSPSRPQAPPQSSSLFISCQPYLSPSSTAHAQTDQVRPLRSSRGIAAKVLTRNSLQEIAISSIGQEGSPLEGFFQGAENASPVAATTERFAEQIELRYQKLARDGIFPDDIGGNQARIVSDVLYKLRNAVASQMNPAPSTGGTNVERAKPASGASEAML